MGKDNFPDQYSEGIEVVTPLVLLPLDYSDLESATIAPETQGKKNENW
jgi:hypothetical protein